MPKQFGAGQRKGVCGMLGLEPLYLACEGRLVIFAPKENAEAIVAKLREGKYSSEAAIIGEVTEEMPGRVVVTTEIGAETLLPPPGGELYQESVNWRKENHGRHKNCRSFYYRGGQ